MVALVNGMKFLDESEQKLYQKVQGFEAQNQKGIKNMNNLDLKLLEISKQVDESLSEFVQPHA